ncbi:MAG: thiamine biosynthesis protein ApbE [Flavobacteriaceae bacterium]|nr:MAG: thiamine biosynthesis protein ApbE [Flavobacteriaceae bacterium]
MKGLLKFRRMKKVFVLGILMVLFSCGEPVKNINQGSALGTTYNITYISNEDLDFQTEIDSVFASINQSMSTYLPDSDISKINQGDSTLVVDAMFVDVFELSRKVYDSTNGYFDPTVGTLVNAWGFGPGEEMKLDSSRVDSLLEYVGFDKVSITEAYTVRKKSPFIYFDFNAIAKGYAIDRLAMMLNQKGINDYLVEVGGELVAKGVNRISEKKWVIGVDDPEGEDRSIPKILLELKDKAMASSGNYRKFRIDATTGKKYVHTINPKTGYTKNSNVLGATVIASTCAEADAYATAFMAMDLDDSIKLLVKQQEMEAYIIYLDENGETAEFMTIGFASLILE